MRKISELEGVFDNPGKLGYMSENCEVSRSERLLRNLQLVCRVLSIRSTDVAKDLGLHPRALWNYAHKGTGRKHTMVLLDYFAKVCRKQDRKLDNVIRDAEALSRKNHLERMAS